MKFNHVANRLDHRHFETVVEMLQVKLDFVELRRTERAIWLRQPGTNVDLQFSRSDTAHRDADKLRSQVSFLSETPKPALEDLAAWLQARGIEAAVGSYSEKEFFLYAPAALVDFVIEAMTPDLADYRVKV
jgi:beta-phosphoglucomutase-like phosphatase (HAD superfamily)